MDGPHTTHPLPQPAKVTAMTMVEVATGAMVEKSSKHRPTSQRTQGPTIPQGVSPHSDILISAKIDQMSSTYLNVCHNIGNLKNPIQLSHKKRV